MAHTKDQSGYPLDPELRQAEFHLGDLAAMWRDAYGQPEQQEKIVQEYRDVLLRMYALGWESQLDVESELPDYLMPEEYLRRNSRFLPNQ